jgi:hypothetical protein
VQEWHGIRDMGVGDKARMMLENEPRKDERTRRDIGRTRAAKRA